MVAKINANNSPEAAAAAGLNPGQRVLEQDTARRGDVQTPCSLQKQIGGRLAGQVQFHRIHAIDPDIYQW